MSCAHSIGFVRGRMEHGWYRSMFAWECAIKNMEDLPLISSRFLVFTTGNYLDVLPMLVQRLLLKSWRRCHVFFLYDSLLNLHFSVPGLTTMHLFNHKLIFEMLITLLHLLMGDNFFQIFLHYNQFCGYQHSGSLVSTADIWPQIFNFSKISLTPSFNLCT